MPDRYCIRQDYTARIETRYYVDGTNKIMWQPDVYDDAKRLAVHLGAKRLVDVGCGDGRKLAAHREGFELFGIDFGENLLRGRKQFPFLVLKEHDLDGDGPLPLTTSDVEGAVVVCSDVIEHLKRPERLLFQLAALLPHAGALLLSTPERELTRGLRHRGPPQNSAHVREWSLREFGAFLRAGGMPHHAVGLTRSTDELEEMHTMLALVTHTAERLDELDKVLIEQPLPRPVRNPLGARLKRSRRALLRKG